MDHSSLKRSRDTNSSFQNESLFFPRRKHSALKSTERLVSPTQPEVGIPKFVNSVIPNRDITPDLRKLKITVWLGGLLALLSVGLAISANELCFQNNFQGSYVVDGLRVVVIGLSGVHWVVIFKYYSYLTVVAEAYGEIYPGSKS
jgi:hypothetical protein